jgi:hypothetical protein
MRVKIQDLPQDLRRRVANKLESLKGTNSEEGVNSAQLAETVCPVYRPDMRAIAYWEFEITGLKNIAPRDHAEKSSGTGFMLASAGGHDVPFPHWSLSSEPPSRALETKAKNGKVNKIVKLDTLCYAAEDDRGNYLMHLGQLPLKIDSLLTADITKYAGISTVTATPSKAAADDKTKTELVVKTEGVKVPKLKLTGWNSYEEMKKGFTKMYSPFLKALAERASRPWEIEQLILKFGEGIHEGEKLTIPFFSEAKIKLAGDGAKFIKTSTPKFNRNAVTLEALPADKNQELNFQLEISYADRTKESLPFFIVPKGTPSNFKSDLPN